MMPPQQLPLFNMDDSSALTHNDPVINAVEPFQEHLRLEGRSPHTIDAFSSDLKLLCEYFGDQTPLKTFSTSNLRKFMDWIETGRGVPCSRKTYARRVTTLKVFFSFLHAEKILPDNPAEALLQRSGAAPLQPIVDETDLERMLAHTTTLRHGEKPDARPDLLLRLLVDTGLKKGEVMALVPDHIDRTSPARPILTVRHRKSKNVYKERKIELDSDWLAVLDEYMEQYVPSDTIFDCTARNLEYILHDIAAAAGVTGKVSFEVLRWTSAVRDYRRGMDLEKLREKMGLSRISWRETSDKIVRLATLQVQREHDATP